MNIYVASSWRNDLQPAIVAALRELNHSVYDFKNPPNGTGFSWTSVNPSWKITDGDKGFVDAVTYKQMLEHPLAAAGFKSDMDALKAADTVVYVLPCGRSASWEFGYAAGAGKATYVVWFGSHEPELMFRDATVIGSMEELKKVFTVPNGARFKIGDIIRYDKGSSALMRVDSISPNHGGKVRYYGTQYYGERMGVYDQDAQPASQNDLITWEDR